MQDLPYSDRRTAGRVLARHLRDSVEDGDDLGDVVVLALPRGGVPVGLELATALGAPLDVLVVRKLGVPGQPELAMGAIASGGTRVLNADVIQGLAVPEEVIERVADTESEELRRRESSYRGDRPPLDVAGRAVILVDDGLATGATMRAAVRGVRQRGADVVIVAVPVAPRDTIEVLKRDANHVVCPATPSMFGGVSRWYEDFRQVTDEQVRQYLASAAER